MKSIAYNTHKIKKNLFFLFLSLHLFHEPLCAHEAPKEPIKRMQIRIVGSSTVFPFASLVQDYFAANTTFIMPYTLSTGTTKGAELFCSGVGQFFPDILNASRPMKDKEKQKCLKNGVENIKEIPIGYDGISLGVSKKNKTLQNINTQDLYLALSSKIYDKKTQKIIPNPYKKWSDISKTLPDVEIQILVPSKEHGSRDAFDALIMENGARSVPEIKELETTNHALFKELTTTFRNDGLVKEITNYEFADDYFLLLEHLERNPNTIAVIGLVIIDEYISRIRAIKIDNVMPSKDTIQQQSYKLARKLYIYVKMHNFQTTEGINEFVQAFLSPVAISNPNGYLTKAGLIPLSNH